MKELEKKASEGFHKWLDSFAKLNNAVTKEDIDKAIFDKITKEGIQLFLNDFWKNAFEQGYEEAK